MKKYLLLLSLVFISYTLSAQVGINPDDSEPAPSAMLDVKSTDKGLLTPRMTTGQRLAISNPAQGLLVFDKTTNSFWYFDNAAWVEIPTLDESLLLVPNCLTEVGSLSGLNSPFDVVVSGNYAYLADRGIKIVDISNPANPVLVGSLLEDAISPRSIAVSGNYAYLSGSNNNLRVVDISDPANPTLTGSLVIDGTFTSLAVSGSYAYLVYPGSGNDELKVVDISNPANPVLAGSLVIGPKGYKVVVSGSYAYVITDASPDILTVINISNPVSPTVESSMMFGQGVTSIAVAGNYAYVLYDNTDELRVIDISDPAAPVLIGNLAIGSAPLDIALFGNYAFVVDGGSDDLKVIDISNPAGPKLTNSLVIGPTPLAVAVSGNKVYAIDGSSGDLKVINWSCSPVAIAYDPVSGDLVSGNIDDADADPTNELQDLSLSGNDLSIANGNSVDLAILQDNLGNHMATQALDLDNHNITNADIVTANAFVGDGSGLTNLPAGNDWSLTGNAGTVNGTSFIGTTDNVALDFRVNNVRALRIEPTAGAPNLIGGYSGNTVTGGAYGATISGGGDAGSVNSISASYATISGGRSNSVANEASTVSGGFDNSATGFISTVGGGRSNSVTGFVSTVGGGFSNTATEFAATVGGGTLNQATEQNTTVAGGENNIASGLRSTVGGGAYNTASGINATIAGGGGYLNVPIGNQAGGYSATVPGGSLNQADGDYSLAAGRRAKIDAAHDGTFLFSDQSDFNFNSAASNEFAARATGGVRFVTAIDGSGNPTQTVSIDNGGTVTATAFVGDGSGLTNLPGDNLGSHTATQALDLANNNITNGGTVTATAFIGDGSALSGMSLSLSGNDLSIVNGNSVDLSGIKDNLGDHTATQNIQLNGNYLSGDGDNEGIFVDGTGQVGIGTSSLDRPLVIKGTGTSSQWMSLKDNTGTTVWHLNNKDGGLNFVETDVADHRLYLQQGGNVGIGTSAPKGLLHVNGDYYGKGHVWLHANEGDGSSGTAYVQARDDSGLSNINLQLRTQNAGSVFDAVLISAEGNVGIGTTTPTKAKVEIIGSQDTDLSYGYLNGNGDTGTDSGDNSYSLYADQRIAAVEFNAFSDARIKNILGPSNRQQDLSTLMHIEITDYTLIDTISKGRQSYKKVIAQQVEKVFPQAVSTITDVVPDIYRRAGIEDGWVQLATDLKPGERVKIITEQSAEVYEVTQVEASRFKVEQLPGGNSQATTVFVYGREVTDFHTVDYEAIAMLNISATQEQQRIIKAQQQRIAELEAQTAQLETKAAQLETQVAQIDALKTANAQMAADIEAIRAALSLSASPNHSSEDQ